MDYFTKFLNMLIKKEPEFLIPKLNKFLENIPSKSSTSTKLSPTYIIVCDRMCIYKMLGCPQKEYKNARFIRIASNGDKMHERFINYFSEMKILRAKEKLVMHSSYPFTGKIDAIINLDGVDYIVELKSISNERFGQLRKPIEEHLFQIKLYMMLTKIFHGILLYENKNTQDLKEFVINYDNQIEVWFKEKMEKLLNYFKNKELPPRICPTLKDGINRWCCYVDICFKEDIS